MTTAVASRPAASAAGGAGRWSLSEAALLGGAVLFSVLAGAWGVVHRAGPWMDEAAAVTTAARPLSGVLSVIAEHERNMALFFVLLHGWMLVSDDFRWLVVLPLTFSVATVIAAARVGHLVAGPRAGAVAAALTAANGALLRFSIEVRGYSLGVLLAVLVVLCLLEGARTGRRRWGVLLVLVGLAFVTTTVLAVLVTGALLVAVLTVPALRSRTAASQLLALLPLQGAVDVAVLLADSGNVDWIAPLSVTAVAKAAWTLAGGPVGVVISAAGLLVLVVPVARGMATLPPQTWLVLSWLLLPFAGLVAFSLLKPLFMTKYLLFVVPALALAVALSAACARSGLLIGTAAAALLAAGALTQPWTAREGDVQAASEVVLEQLRPGDAVVYAPEGGRALFGHWLGSWAGPGPRPVDVALADGGDPWQVGDPYGNEVSQAVLAQRISASPRTWLVEYHHPGTRPTVLPRDLAGLVAVEHEEFGAASVTLLVPAP